MSAINSFSQIRSTDHQEYEVEGGVTIYDKVAGIGKAIFQADLATQHQTSIYKILINDKKLIVPTCVDPSLDISVIFKGSVTITFERKDHFIKITEFDASRETVLYVDPRNLIRGIAYDAYKYIPTEISLENAMQKVACLKQDFPNFKGEMAVYNRHGVVIFGWDTNDKKYALCWASPDQEKVEKMECVTCTRYPGEKTSIAKSSDGNVNFRHLASQGPYLNAEAATQFSLPE
jgi:hypothetical protein